MIMSFAVHCIDNVQEISIFATYLHRLHMQLDCKNLSTVTTLLGYSNDAVHGAVQYFISCE